MPPPVAASTGDNAAEATKSSLDATKESAVAPNARSTEGKNDESKPRGGTQPKQKGAELSKEEKHAIKEAKEKAKAEKAAKRAQEKQNKQGQPTLNVPRGNQAGGSNESKRRGSNAASTAVSTPKQSHHKRTASTGQKALPIRVTDAQHISPSSDLKRNDKKVALFDHLYGPPRRSTLAGAGKDVHPAILALGLQLSSYAICGSNARCVAMLLAFKQTIQAYNTPPHTSLPRHLTTHLSSQIEYLVSCRPLSVSMGNSIRWLKLEISAVDISTPESTAKIELCNAIDNFIRERITVADQVIADKSSDKIHTGDIIVTFAKSSIVQKTLLEAYKQGKKFKVIVVDSRPLLEGKNLARALSELGLDVQYSHINGIDHIIKSATKVFLGAHAMMSNGRLYSRVGTALVAMAAHERNISVIVCCESIKFTDRVALDSFVHNEIAPPDELILSAGEKAAGLDGWRDIPNLQLLNLMYDLTPAEFINMVITEYGSLPPSSVPVVHRLSTNT